MQFIRIFCLLTALLLCSACGSKKIPTTSSKNAPAQNNFHSLQLKKEGGIIAEKSYALLKEIYAINFAYNLKISESISYIPCFFLSSLLIQNSNRNILGSEIQSCLTLAKQIKYFLNSSNTRSSSFKKIKEGYPKIFHFLNKTAPHLQRQEIATLSIALTSIGQIFQEKINPSDFDTLADQIAEELSKQAIASGRVVFETAHTIVKDSIFKEFVLPKLFSEIQTEHDFPSPYSLPTNFFETFSTFNDISIDNNFNFLFQSLQNAGVRQESLEKILNNTVIPNIDIRNAIEKNFNNIHEIRKQWTSNLPDKSLEYSLVSNNLIALASLSSLFPNEHCKELPLVLHHYLSLQDSIKKIFKKSISEENFIYKFLTDNLAIFYLAKKSDLNSCSWILNDLHKTYEFILEKKDLLPSNKLNNTSSLSQLLKILSMKKIEIEDSFTQKKYLWDFAEKIGAILKINYLDTFQINESFWTMEIINYLQMNLTKFPLQKPSSSFIEVVSSMNEKISILQSKDFLKKIIDDYEATLDKVETIQEELIQSYENTYAGSANIREIPGKWLVRSKPVSIWEYATSLGISKNDQVSNYYRLAMDKKSACTPMQHALVSCICTITKEHRIYLTMPGQPQKILGHLYYGDYSEVRHFYPYQGTAQNYNDYLQHQYNQIYNELLNHATSFNEQDQDIPAMERVLEKNILKYLEPIQNNLAQSIAEEMKKNKYADLLNEFQEKYKRLIALLLFTYHDDLSRNLELNSFILGMNRLKNKEALLQAQDLGSSKHRIQMFRKIMSGLSPKIIPTIWMPFLAAKQYQESF